MPATFALRNYTSYPLTVRFAGLQAGDKVKDRRDNNLDDLDSVKPGIHARYWSKDENDCEHAALAAYPYAEEQLIVIEPFSLGHLVLPTDNRRANRCMITISDRTTVDFTCDIPPEFPHANILVPSRASDTLPNLNAIYLGTERLAITEGVNMKRWMQPLPDYTPLEQLRIPGTHNSPAYHRALPSVRCQIVSPLEQLEHGVRFLDVRLQVDKPRDNFSDSLSLVHSVFPVAMSGSRKFRSLYSDILGFLSRNPSETVILSLKREGRGSGTDKDLAQRLHDYYISEKYWVIRPGIPTLGEARGKIVLLRRYQLNDESRELYSRAIGIDAQVWADNSPSSCAGDVHVQDFYEVLHIKNIESKIQFIHEHCERANATMSTVDLAIHKPLLFLNFLSASNFWRKGCWPEKIASNITPAITQYLFEMQATRGQRGVGILVIDWVGDVGNWDLVKIIVAMNETLLVQPDKC